MSLFLPFAILPFYAETKEKFHLEIASLFQSIFVHQGSENLMLK